MLPMRDVSGRREKEPECVTQLIGSLSLSSSLSCRMRETL